MDKQRTKPHLLDIMDQHNIVKKLILIRGLRSIGQGAMVVDLTLYLKALHWSGASIGGVTSSAGLFGALMILGVGILSDRKGRKPFLLIYEFMTFLSAAIACFTVQALFLTLAIVVAGFGRGQSGAAGPFSPAEQAWLARYVDRKNRGRIFSYNNAVGFLGMALGAVIGGIPEWIHTNQPIDSYRPVFIMVSIVSLFCIYILLGMKEKSSVEESSHISKIAQEKQSNDHTSGTNMNLARSVDEPHESQIRKQENKHMLKLALVNVLNGLAVGLTGPLMAYWFSIRYGVSTAAIGVTLSVGFLMTGISSILNGFLAQRIGMIKSVTWMRVIGSVFMLALPWMPNFATASFLYVLRGAINRGTQGNRSALSSSLTRDKRRGLATSINALSMRLPASIGPTLTGYMFDMGLLSLPLLLTATLQLANAGIYQWMFRRFDVK